MTVGTGTGSPSGTLDSLAARSTRRLSSCAAIQLSLAARARANFLALIFLILCLFHVGNIGYVPVAHQFYCVRQVFRRHSTRSSRRLGRTLPNAEPGNH